jgi:hypothetical protein
MSTSLVISGYKFGNLYGFSHQATKRDLASIIKVASSLSPPDKQTVKTALVNKIGTLKDSDVASRGLASTVGGAVAGGATSAVVGNLLNRKLSRDDSFIWAQSLTQLPFAEIESLFRREAQLHSRVSVEPSDDDDDDSSGSGITSAVAGGAASAVVGNLLNKIEGLFRRDE